MYPFTSFYDGFGVSRKNLNHKTALMFYDKKAANPKVDGQASKSPQFKTLQIITHPSLATPKQ